MARTRGRNKRTKSVKNTILFAVVLVFIIAIIGGTYSRYISSGTAQTTGEIAKWNVKIGSTNLSEVEDFELTARSVEGISNENIASDKLAPGQTLAADLQVNPTGTEVAVDYVLTMGAITTEGFNTNSSVRVSKVEATVDGEDPVEVYLVDGKYTFYESLADVLEGKKVTFRAYVVWDDTNNAADTANGGGAVTSVQVPVQITAQQHLEQDGFITYSDSSKTLMVMAGEVDPNGTLLLKEDITYDDYNEYPTSSGFQVEFEDNAVFNLGGKTVTAPNGALNYLGDNLTIENGNFVGLISPYEGRYGMHLWNDSGTSDVSTGVVIQNVTTTGINVYNEEVTLKNVTATVPNDAKYYAVYGNVYSTITIESGTYTAGTKTTALFGYLGYDNTEIGVATEDGRNPQDGFKIYGGTFNTNGKPFCLTSGNHIPPVIYGGTFDCDVSDYVAEGHTCTQTGTNVWVVE